MAWELQNHMHGYIAPSVAKAADAEEDAHQWLANRYADQRWNEEHGSDAHECLVNFALDLPQDTLINAITAKAIEISLTTNGAWEVYLDDGLVSVPWCDEDEMLAWYG